MDAFAHLRRCIMEAVVIICGLMVGSYLFKKLGGNKKK